MRRNLHTVVALVVVNAIALAWVVAMFVLFVLFGCARPARQPEAIRNVATNGSVTYGDSSPCTLSTATALSDCFTPSGGTVLNLDACSPDFSWCASRCFVPTVACSGVFGLTFDGCHWYCGATPLGGNW